MRRSLLVGATLRVGALGLCASSIAADAPPEGYMDHKALSAKVKQIAGAGVNVHLDVLAKSGQEREVFLMTLAADQSQAGSKPALLITAGIDARHRVGTETALRVAQRLLDDHADLLKDMTVYVIPCVNPDGMEFNATGQVRRDHIGNLHPVDDDRDGAVDEDGPQDINGDGAITMMRRPGPPLDDAATMMADPAEPRLLKKPDAEKGERALYAVYVEGLDVDGDGKIAEDGPGQVDLDKNFMHRWPEHVVDAGDYQLSEMETAALAKFVLEHRNIVAAITYGRHDNLVDVPDSRPKDITDQAPKDLDGDDAGYYKEISKRYKEITGQERAAAPGSDTAGSFQVWLYAQRGIPSFATTVWGRPEPPKPKEAETKPSETQPASQPATQPDHDPQVNFGAIPESMSFDDDLQEQTPPSPRGGRRRPPAGGGPPGERSQRGDPGGDGGGDKKEEKNDKPKPADPEAAAWLEYSDRERHGEGFIEWKPFDHPTLGKLEIGGFVPGFQMNPPADHLDSLAEKQTKFAVELMGKRPKIAVDGPTVKKLAAGLYEVRFGLVNDGYLPTATAMARKARSIMPTILRLSVPVEQIVAGERVIKTWAITGGERTAQRWIVRVEDGSEITIDINNPQLGKQTIKFRAEESP